MKTLISLAGGVLVSVAAAQGALADGGFQSHYADCVEKFATSATGASVTLECNAGAGKLAACKVLDDSAPGRGFGKAAICVAAFLPVGSKTGLVRVPVRFNAA